MVSVNGEKRGRGEDARFHLEEGPDHVALDRRFPGGI
jgi:hypothetical protein